MAPHKWTSLEEQSPHSISSLQFVLRIVLMYSTIQCSIIIFYFALRCWINRTRGSIRSLNVTETARSRTTLDRATTTYSRDTGLSKTKISVLIILSREEGA